MRSRKTFTGCWTCRARRLKCDEGKPECTQCRAKGVRCEGYHTRLQWMRPNSIYGPHKNDVPADGQGLQRRRLLPASRLKRLSIEAALSDIEQAASQSEPKSCGPFSVFSLDSADEEPGPLPVAFEPIELPAELVDAGDLAPPLSDGSFNGDDVIGLDVSDDAPALDLQCTFVNEAPAQEYLEEMTTNSHGPQQMDGSIATPTIISPQRDRDQTTEAEDQCSVTTLSHQTPSEAAGTTYVHRSAEGEPPEDVFLKAEVKHLLRNYANNVLPIFSPLDRSTSPWRSFHLSRALQGSIELEILNDAPRSRRALLHTILTISAYNLRNVHSSDSETSRKWSHVASHYKCEALNLLETCVGDSAADLSHSVYNELLAAMLCMVTIDVIAGETSTSEIHLQASETLIRARIARCGDSILDVTKGLHVIFLYLRTMQEATKLLCDQPQQSPGSMSSPRSGHQDPEDVAELMFSAQPPQTFDSWSLEMIYGLPESLLLLLRKATRILRYSSQFASGNDADTSDLALKVKIQELEDEILEWPVEEAVARLDSAPASEGNRLVMQHYTRALHQAIIIFYSRKARNVHRRHVQPYVHEVIHHLEKIEHVKERYGLRTGHMPRPAFVAGSQAIGQDIQNRFLKWFDKISTEGIWTSNLSKDALMDIWTQTSTPVGFSALSGLHLILT